MKRNTMPTFFNKRAIYTLELVNSTDFSWGNQQQQQKKRIFFIMRMLQIFTLKKPSEEISMHFIGGGTSFLYYLNDCLLLYWLWAVWTWDLSYLSKSLRLSLLKCIIPNKWLLFKIIYHFFVIIIIYLRRRYKTET